MLYLLDKDAKTVKWNGIPLHEASSAIVKEETNGDFYLTISYPITDSGIYQLIKEDMLIKAPAPVLGAQLFRIKKPVENDDSLDITAYHVSDDVMQRSINPVSVVGQGCAMALSQMVQNAKTGLGDFSFTSDIMDSRTFNTTETETLYSVLMDGKHSIVGTWEGELVRDNFALSIKRSRGADRGVVITTHKNLKSYQRTKNSQGVVTRIHAQSTFRAEGAETDTVLTVTVDSPLIGNYPYINEKEYENNNAKTVEELRKWAEDKFKNEGIDKISDAIEIEAYELDGQVVHLGDTVNIKSSKHSVDIYKKAIAYEYNALTEEYISITFDDKPGVGGSGVSSGVANAADVILSANQNAQEVAIERAVKNANQAFDAEFDKRVEVIKDGIEQAKAEAELYADSIKQSIDAEIDAVNTSMQEQSEEHDRQVADILSKTQSVEELANQAKTDAASAIARANQVKTEAIADARAQVATVSQALNTAKTDLQNQVNAVDAKAVKVQSDATALRTDLNLQAGKILEQAQAQTALTNRVTTVETLADGTKTTVAELSKTVSKATSDIASVTSRTKTVEDTLSQTRTQYEALTQTVNAQTGQIDSINRKTADLQSGIDGVTERFENLQVGGENLINNTGKPFVMGYGITNTTWNPDTQRTRLVFTSSVNRAINNEILPQVNTFHGEQYFIVKRNQTYTQSIRIATDATFLGKGNLSYTWFGPEVVSGTSGHRNRKAEIRKIADNEYLVWCTTTWNSPDIKLRPFDLFYLHTALDFRNTGTYIEFYKPKLETGNLPTDWCESNTDFNNQIAEYKRTADQNYAGLQSTVSTLDGKVTQNKTEANQTATQLSNRLTSVEAYKDGETTRSQAYFEASKTETARQITAERTAISANYVAKSTYDENVSGTTLKLNEVKTTADTTKQNLATYQETVNRKLTELTSSDQTLDGKINAASTKVDTVAGQIRTEISTVEGKIPTTIGATNYIRDFGFANNYNFNQHTSGWQFERIEDSTARSGYHIKATCTKAGAMGFHRVLLDLQGAEWQGRKMTYSIDVKASKLVRMRLGVEAFDKGYKAFDVTTDWKRFISTDTVNFKTWFSFPFYTDTITWAVGDIVYIRDPQLEDGNIATTPREADEDLKTDITSIKTTITQTSQGVEQLTTSLATTDGKVTTAETKINQLIGEVSSKVSQTDYNTLTGRVSNAETAITQNETEISKRLTSTQVNQAILVGKQIKDTRSDNQSPQWYWTNYPKQTVEEFKASAVIGLTSESKFAILTTNVHWTDSSGGKVKQTAKTDRATFERYGTGTTWEAWTKIANAGDLANYTTKTEFQTVKETTSLYERVIGSTEENVKDKIARIVMADSLFMTEVKNKVDGTSTQVTQLSDSYAIKNLTNSGTVLNQLNLNKDGSIKIDGSLVQITGTTYIQDGVISSAKIANLDAGKITTGTLNAARIATNSITGSHILFDQAFFNSFMANEAYLQQLFAKNAFITQVQAVTLSASKISGGTLTATNGAMGVNLNAGQILYYTDQAALKRVLSGYPTQFIKFGTGTQSTDNAFRLIGAGSSSSIGASIASFGTNRNNGENNLDGGFTGVNIYSGGTTGTNVVDRIELASDILQIAHAASTGIANDPRGWTFENQNSVNNNYVFRPNTSPNSAYKALIGTSVTPINELYIDEAYIKGQRLGWILKDIANRVGHGGWANYIS